MIFLLVFCVISVLGFGVIVLISTTSTSGISSVRKSFIGRTFVMKDDGINDVSKAPRSENYSKMTASEKSIAFFMILT